MAPLLRTLFRRPAPLAYTGALLCLLALALPWLRAEGAGSYSALQSAQLFLGPAAWLLFGLGAGALLCLLRPLHAMHGLAVLLAGLALPLWLSVVLWLLLGTQHQGLASGSLLAGLGALLLSASAGLELWVAAPARARWVQRLSLLVARGLSLR